MSLSIKISPSQYQICFSSPSLQKSISQEKQWLVYLKSNQSSPALVILINQHVVELIVGRYLTCSSSSYQFQKFKFYSFSQIATGEQYKKINQIFNWFKQWPEIKREELKAVEKELRKVKKQLTIKRKKDLPSEKQIQHKIKTIAERQLFLSEAQEHETQSGKYPLHNNPSHFKQEESEEERVVHLDLKQLKKRVSLNLSSSSEDEILSLPPQENEVTKSLQDLRALKLEENTQLRLYELFEEVSQAQLIKDEKQLDSLDVPEIVPIPLPEDILAIVDEPFLLEPPLSLQDLFLTKEAEESQALYSKNLKTLLHFENKVSVEKLVLKDQRFEQYLKKVDLAFQRAWELACKQSIDLHHEFLKAFPENPAKVVKDYHVLCTAAQLDWVIYKISHQFPALYQLAFDAPYFKIYQSQQMAFLAQVILVGSQAAAKEIFSPCCIRLSETECKEIKILEQQGEKNPLIQAKSFIYTHFITSRGPIASTEEKRKEQLHQFAKEYVRDWLERSGVFLQLGTIQITGGQANESIKASDWVMYVRNQYVKTLLAMTKEELNTEMTTLFSCPLVRLIAKTYGDDIEAKEWTTSLFPAALMKKMFEEELKRTRGQHQIQQGIHQTIQYTHLSQQDVEVLAAKVGCTTPFIEPLLRIRILYMIGCLGQSTTEPVVKGLIQRAKTMYDPALGCDGEGLVCQSSERRVLSFDHTFDQLDIKVKTTFKDPNKIHILAQGYSSLWVSSISGSKENKVTTAITDLQDLSFSLYSSKVQRRYLTAQIAPQTLIQNMAKLASDIDQLEIVKKTNQIKNIKQNNETLWGGWWNFFDYKPYQKIEQDQQYLASAIHKAKYLAAYVNTQRILQFCNQLTHAQLKIFQESYEHICKQIDSTLQILQELYSQENENHVIFKQIKQLKELRYLDEEKIRVCAFESSRNVTSSSAAILSEEEVEDLDKENEAIIGKTTGVDKKGLVSFLWENTIGYLTKESSEVKYFQWKIERYEDLISGLQTSIVSYIKNAGLSDDVHFLVKEAKAKQAPEWMQQLFPIFKFCRKKLQIDCERLNLDYLDKVRKTYTRDFLEQLRNAATWAKGHSSSQGAPYIDAICYQFYTSLNLNRRFHEIIKTFTELGQLALVQKKDLPVLPSDSRYDLIRNLFLFHEQIKAVPNDAKAPLLKQWANSARGHLNGLWGMATFDPNMQSNPIHVFFNKVIKFKEKGLEKEITVKNIAMGTPTIEVGDGKAEVNPEFQGFLRHCKRLGQRHLYINHQNFIPRAWVKGDESVRCQALHDLAEKEFKDTLYVITLSQNSPFYEQTGHQLTSLNVSKTKDEIIAQLLDGKSKEMRHYLPAHLISQSELHTWMAKEIDHIHQKEFNHCLNFDNESTREKFVQHFHDQLRVHVEKLLQTSPSIDGKGLGYSIYHPSISKFKQEVITQMFDRLPHETGNYIPPEFVKKCDLREWSVKTVNTIHQTIFNEKDQLTVEERRFFIRLFYLNLSRKVLIETQANSYNVSCKDRIDRGARTDAEDFAEMAIVANYFMMQHVIQFFSVLVFVRAIIVRKRTIIESYLKALIQTVKFMIDHQKQLQQLHVQLFPHIEMTIDQFTSLEKNI